MAALQREPDVQRRRTRSPRVLEARSTGQGALHARTDRIVEALRADPSELPPNLRVKRVQGHDGIWELTWAADRRATFEYGDEQIPGQPHVCWRRIGSHSILSDP